MNELTLDIPMQLALRVKVLQPFQQLPRHDSDVLLSKHTTLELPSAHAKNIIPNQSAHDSPLPRKIKTKDGRELTKSEHDPPEQNSMMIHRFEPFKNEPWYLYDQQLHQLRNPIKLCSTLLH